MNNFVNCSPSTPPLHLLAEYQRQMQCRLPLQVQAHCCCTAHLDGKIFQWWQQEDYQLSNLITVVQPYLPVCLKPGLILNSFHSFKAGFKLLAAKAKSSSTLSLSQVSQVLLPNSHMQDILCPCFQENRPRMH